MIKNKIIVDDLKRSGLTAEDVQPLGWYELKAPNIAKKLKELIGFTKIHGHSLPKVCTAFLVIPYQCKDFSRVRIYPPVEDLKYLQPKNTPVAAYIPDVVWSLKGKPSKPVILTEGEKKAACLIKRDYHAIGLPGVWCFRNKSGKILDGLHAFDWTGRTVHICFDSDAIFNKQVRQAEMELAVRFWTLGAEVYIIRIPQPNHKEKQGADDFIVSEGIEKFRGLMKDARHLYNAYSFEFSDELTRVLAKLYEADLIPRYRLRELSKQLAKGWKANSKDVFLHALNTAGENETKEEQPIVECLEPFDGEVDGAKLATEIEQILKQRVVIHTPGAYVAITLWVFLTYLYHRFNICPLLLITSPTKRCGKTTLITILEALSHKALVLSNLTPAVAFRVIDKYKPTLLADEADAGLKDNEDLRGIFNAGHTRRTAFVIRCGDKKENFDPIRFNVFCPKAIAAIRKLPDTWLDRGIKIHMQRKGVSETVQPPGLDFFEKNRELRRRLLKWAGDSAKDLDPNIEAPNISNDRAKDNWRPLLAIADALGGDWPAKAQQAMLELEAAGAENDLRVELLRDIQDVFCDSSRDKIFSKDLVDALNSLSDRPWADFNHGKGLTTNRLASLLKPFQIEPKQIRIGAETRKGYRLDLLEPVFNRYIPPDQNETPKQPSNDADLGSKENETQSETQNTRNETPKQNNTRDPEKCFGVSVCDEDVSFHVTDQNGCRSAPDKQCFGVSDKGGGDKGKKIRPLFGTDEGEPRVRDYEEFEL